MARHHHHHRRHRRHNPLGINGSVIKDSLWNSGGLLASLYGAKLLGQSGWLDVGATLGAAVAASFVAKAVGQASASEEVLKGGVSATILKAIGQTGAVNLNLGLGLYVPSYFSAPTSSDAYGRATAPTVMLPAPTAGAKGMGGGKFRSRFASR
jgi:hypothetical protein